MPDFSKNEETETRTHSLCLFGVPGITSNRRCENCPGPARTPLYHQRRCPLDSLESNIFSPVAAERSEINLKSLLASSSKQHETDEELPAKMAGMSLVDPCVDGTARKFGRSKSEPGIRNVNTDISMSDHHVDVGAKRKAAILDQPESSSRNELAGSYSQKAAHLEHTEADQKAKSNKEGAVCLVDGSSDVKKRLQNKQQKLFEDLNPRSEPLLDCWGIPADVPASLSSLLYRSPTDTQEDRHSERVSLSGIFISGFLMDTENQGLHSCQEGIYNTNDPEEVGLMGMEIEERTRFNQ